MKILIAEDERVSRHQLQTFLQKWGYKVAVAVDGVEALKIINEPDCPRLAILDRMMPNLNGLEVCRAIREQGSEPYIYIILLTAEDRQEDVLEGFAAGADDYIKKPFEAQELKARVQTGARIVELQEQLIAAREEIRFEGMHDSLTRVLNRVAFFEIFQREVSRARRKESPLALIMVDVDHFKKINDTYGHLVGDTVLKETARRLQISLRASDAIGRYGGEEFVIVAPDCTEEGALILGERFRRALASAPVTAGGAELAITISVGVATTKDMSEAPELLRRADEALYKAKGSGRNTTVLAGC